ncbi:MAG: glycosyltransferase family 2 protein [Verrucomicrobiae bacterium]|nr:glycosyltransferase family 2 protein [Verrucomicrobiae bacterium]
MSLLVSIVTPSFNQARFLKAALESVSVQSYLPIEHIVIDGGSTDGSCQILASTPNIKWISEPDHGQVHAINKGFEMASGDILAWLNSDDMYCPTTVDAAVSALNHTGADLVYGDVEIIDEGGHPLKISRGIPFDFRILLYGINYIGQQTVFFRRDLLKRAGPLREEFDNAFDFELWLRFAQYGRFFYAPDVRARIRHHSAAKSIARAHITSAERRRIRAEYWSKGGWPLIFSRPPLFTFLNLSYRLKRKLLIRLCRDENRDRRPRCY